MTDVRQRITWHGSRFAIFPTSLIRHFSSREFRVYLALATHSNDDGRCWPAMRTVEQMTGLDRRSVQRTLNKLELAGAILSYPRQGPKCVSIYELQPEPQAYVEAMRDGQSGPGGLIVSLVFTALESLVDRGLIVEARLRAPAERNAYIDRLNTGRGDREAIRTPGVRLVLAADAAPASSDEGALSNAAAELNSLESLIAGGYIPWSVFLGTLDQVTERAQKGGGQNDRQRRGKAADKTAAQVADKTTAGGGGQNDPADAVTVSAQTNQELTIGTDQGTLAAALTARGATEHTGDHVYAA